MDESLEIPNVLSVKPASGGADGNVEEVEDSSGEEDGGLDWTKLPGASRPVIPKRGEKEFEPRANGGTNLQIHVLDRSRSAMLEALKANRATSSKAISYGIWCPGIARVNVTVARGIHFSNMGHSAPRSTSAEKLQKRLELLPEEAIYLIERGSMFCWKENENNPSAVESMADVAGTPMTVQQAYAEMIGKEGLTLERFQVFAYLKRLGYIVTRAKPPSSFYPIPPPFKLASSPWSLLSIFASFRTWISRVTLNWWRPITISRWLHHDKNPASLFRSMRLLSTGHDVVLHAQNDSIRKEESPYTIFYNLYKPSTPFKKSAPPTPDFQIVVINARTTPMPTLYELCSLFDDLPQLPPPVPRQRKPAPGQLTVPKPKNSPAESSTKIRPSLIHRLFPWAFKSPETPTTWKPNPFMMLKNGRKMVIIAVVDAGSISFYRFHQGAFADWPML